MSPIKLIVIALLLYLGYRLLTSGRKKKRDTEESFIKDDAPVEDVLVEDPVCHKLVPKGQAVRLNSRTRGEIVYFCSEECCNLFVSQEGEKE